MTNEEEYNQNNRRKQALIGMTNEEWRIRYIN
jgi:hypothetical protein